MTAVTAALVKELREKTGAGMLDCKKALGETGGDVEAAVDWLRTKGLASAAKKAGRVAAEGLVGVAVDGTVGAVVELNAETDFVARNEQFQALVAAATKAGLTAGGDIEALKAAGAGDGKTVAEAVTHAIATIGENMTLRRYETVAVEQGIVASYVHGAVVPGMGRIGVLVGLQSAAPAEKLAEVGKQLAMHVAAANPQSVDVNSLDPVSVERERAVLVEQARASGRPENIIEKMVEGRLRKFYEESVLVEQVWVLDPDKRVKTVLEELGKEIDTPVTCTGFVRMALGEGVEREEQDFAAEVAATLKS